MDEFDIEVTRLDPRIRDDAAQRGEPSSQADQAESGTVASPLIPAPDDPAVGRASASGRRTPRVIAIFGLSLLIATLLLLIEGPAAQDALRTLRPTATPRPAIAGSGRIFFLHSVPWGILRVDHDQGPNLNAAPRLFSDGQPVLPYSDLPPGRHIVQYDAQLFPHFECLLSIPARADDTCGVRVVDMGSGELDLGARVDRLPPVQRVALIAATEAALADAPSSVLLLPGTRFRGADGSVVVAEQPLYAELLVSLNRQDSSRPATTDSSCALLCDIDGLYRDNPDPAWQLYVDVVVSWRYRRIGPSGPSDIVVDQAPVGDVTDDAHLRATIKAAWTGTWRVTLTPGAPCKIEEHMVQRLEAAHSSPNQDLGGRSYPDYTSTACLFAGTSYNAAIRDFATFYLLYRFGVLIAANDAAHRLFPELPVATAEEAALARQIATTAVGTG